MKNKTIVMAQELNKTSKISGRSSLDPSQIVLGSYDYSEIRESSALIDKTMLIKDFVNSGDKVSLITCPRRFGKSTNMNMIKTFLQMKVDANGNQITDLEKNENYQNFKKEINDKRLKIMEEHSFVRDHFANHPVIFVNFKDAGKGSKFENVEIKIKRSISRSFLEHEYMIKVFKKIIQNSGDEEEEKKAEDYLKKFKKIYETDGENANTTDIEDSLKFLCMILYNHFGKKAYVLIDEYDAPVQDAMWRNGVDLKNIIDYFDAILCPVLKDNDYLQKGLMTGISSLVRASATSGLNNVTEYKFLCKRKFSKYYGFTEAEVFQLLNDFGMIDDHKDKVKSWYDGYKVAGNDMAIYNTWSIVKFLQENEYQSYWENSGAINNIYEIFKVDGIRKIINKLIDNEHVEFELIKNLTINDLKNLQNLLNCNGGISSNHVDLFFSYMFELGYLSFSGDKNVYKIPNKEIETVFISLIKL